MMETNQKDLIETLGKFSSLLIKEKLIDPEADKSAMIEAINKVLFNLNQPPSPKKPTFSSVNFIKGPLASMNFKHQKARDHLEELRKQRAIAEASQLQSKPNINSSRKISKMPPIYQRSAKILQEKAHIIELQRANKEKEEEEALVKTCTFRPLSRSNNSLSSRSPNELTKSLYKWNEDKLKTIEKKRAQKEAEERKELEEKPKIDNLSAKLSKNRCSTPVHERLFGNIQKKKTNEIFAFQPYINEKSSKILHEKLTKSHKSSIDASSSRKTETQSIYSISTGLSTLDRHLFYVNTLEVSEKTRDFFNRLDNL